MAKLGSEYRFLEDKGWSLCVRPDQWSRELWAEILRQMADQPPARHPQTKRFRHPAEGKGREFYLKVYHRSDFFGAVKDLFRRSKALRALAQGVVLAEDGFHAPLAAAAGEERRLRVLRRAFLLTVSVEGAPLPQFLRDHFASPLRGSPLRDKRKYLRRLAAEIRRLHRAGFVHGDLVPSNIFLRVEPGGVTFFYMDNDRTRRYPRWLLHGLWKRNLVQLNRFVLPGISLQDRMRFLRVYLGETSWLKRKRKLLRWLENKTRQRRLECEQINAQVSFRELMRWNGPFARNIESISMEHHVSH